VPTVTDLLPFIVIGLVSGSVYGLAGVGLVLTYRTSGVFNFAHGATAAATAFLFYQLWTVNGLRWPLAFLLAVCVFGPLAGLFLEVIARSLTNAPTSARVVATLGILVAVQQLLVLKFGAATLQLPVFLPVGLVKVAGVYVGVDQIVVMVVALVGTVGLSAMLRFTRLGLQMRGVVDNTDLLALTGTSPKQVRRASWCIGSAFGGLSGVLLAPSIGLDAFILTLLVVNAFGAAALGLFRSLPLTYVGGLVIGVGGALATKYVGSTPSLIGLPPSFPFIVLILILLLVPRRRLVDVSAERRPAAPQKGMLSGNARRFVIVLSILCLALVPQFAGTKLIVYTTGLVFVMIFLSLVVLERFSGQLSLSQLAFVALGGTTFATLVSRDVPWLFAVLLAGFIVLPVGAVLAIPAIRLSGLYLALATLGFGLVMSNLVYGSGLMFGAGPVNSPRPGLAESDTAYYYVALLFVLAVALLVMLVRSSRLGRLLRAMSDSQVALATHGMNATVVKVLAFCISAFIAGLAGALLGPVTGQLSPTAFGVFPSLLLVVIFALQSPLPDIPAAFAAAAGMIVVPSYIGSETLTDWLPVVFGVAAVGVALMQASGQQADGGNEEVSVTQERLRRNPGRQRLAEARLRLAEGGGI